MKSLTLPSIAALLLILGWISVVLSVTITVHVTISTTTTITESFTSSTQATAFQSTTITRTVLTSYNQ